MQKFVKDLEQRYQLKQDIPAELLNLKFTASSGYLKQNLENLFRHLNRMEFITSKEMYDQALGLFQVDVRKAGRGHMVFVTDENGVVIRHPMKLSDFDERPKFYLSKQELLGQDQRVVSKQSKDGVAISTLKSLVIKELIWQIQTQFGNRTLKKSKKQQLKESNKRRNRRRYR